MIKEVGVGGCGGSKAMSGSLSCHDVTVVDKFMLVLHAKKRVAIMTIAFSAVSKQNR